MGLFKSKEVSYCTKDGTWSKSNFICEGDRNTLVSSPTIIFPSGLLDYGALLFCIEAFSTAVTLLILVKGVPEYLSMLDIPTFRYLGL